MNPKAFKNQIVNHTPSNTTFLCVKCGKKEGVWWGKDSEGNYYCLDQCKVVELDVLALDVRKLKEADSVERLEDLFEKIKQERFSAAWNELEKNPVETVAVAVLYCLNWTDFLSLVDEYGVSEKVNPTLSALVKNRLREKGFEARLVNWHTEYKQQGGV